MSPEELDSRLDYVGIVYRDSTTGYYFVYNGAHTINVYDEGLTSNFDVISVGDFALDAATEDDVRDGIRAWLEVSNG
jgi:hypothetical protein